MKATHMPLLPLLVFLLASSSCDSGGVTWSPDTAADAAEDSAPGEDSLVPMDSLPDTPPILPDTAQDLSQEIMAEDVVPDLPGEITPPPCLGDGDCDDGDKCTMDGCEDGICVHAALPPGFCCVDDGDCDDGIVCTVDQCLNGACWNLPEDSSCCADGGDCEDFDDCTVDLCIGSTCAHVFASDDGPCQCADFLDCDDGLPCTDESCVGGACVYALSPAATGCCLAQSDCDDGDPGTADVCVQSTCGNAPWGLCLVDEHCDDEDPCTLDRCEDGICATELLPGCCYVDAQCADALPETTDLCLGGDCLHVLTPSPAACVNEGDCPAAPPCLSVSCIGGDCSYGFGGGGGCCLSSADCDDSDPCTTETCDDAHLCQSAPLAGLVPHQTWDFGDPALPGFEISGGSGAVTWGAHFSMFISPPRSLHFGDPVTGSFATGSAVSGTARSPLVQLPDQGEIRLEGATFIDVEPLFSRDLVWISVESAGGGSTEVWNKEAVGGTTALAWLTFEVDLSSYAGEAVRIVFGFDSIDEVNNNGAGAFFDDVSILWTCGD